MTDKKVAVVFGASGIIGRNLAERLASSGSWEVVSVARHAHNDLPGSRPIACDLSDAKSAQ
jgi:NAD(P)-dependent dehydrogenase (short-subunit alcohol dehydrogenase family)